MSTSNPTGLRIGMSGSLSGRHYSILGRVVMSMQEDGQTWYWNEFFLKASDGSEATLVFEDTESGPAWRFFEYFEPSRPFTLAEAGSIRAGTTIELDGLSGVVDRVDTSRVYHIEGQAPEGVDSGDVSTYFNATLNDSMLVVSWAHGEVEHFWGQDISREQVTQAFGAADLTGRPSPFSAVSYASDSHSNSSNWGNILTYVGLAFVGIIWLLCKLPSGTQSSYSGLSASEARQIPEKTFWVGSTYQDDGRDYIAKAEFLTEYSTTSLSRHGRFYQLETENGAPLELFQGTEQDVNQCRVIHELPSGTCPQPTLLASLHVGQKFSCGTEELRVLSLFRLRLYTLNTPGGAPMLSQTRYGLIARNDASGTWQFDWSDDKETHGGPLSLHKMPLSTK